MLGSCVFWACYLARVLLLLTTRERGGFSRPWRQAHLQRIARAMPPDHQCWIVSPAEWSPRSPREDSTSVFFGYSTEDFACRDVPERDVYTWRDVRRDVFPCFLDCFSCVFSSSQDCHVPPREEFYKFWFLDILQWSLPARDLDFWSINDVHWVFLPWSAFLFF